MFEEVLEPTSDDIRFMRMALKEAEKGLGRTSPNPCVGAVIVHDDGGVISRGYHHSAGTPHAEVHALQAAGDRARGATIYVTLEPCNHTGRTPPCSHAVAAAGLRRVVIGMEDPNPLVNGSGSDYLKGQGLEVCTGVLEEECREMVRPFLKHILTGKPFVVMKAGMSLDGKLTYQKGVPGRMTGAESRQRVHHLRNSLDAILIGRGTLMADDPSLTTRLTENGRDPIRVILDSSLSISAEAQVLNPDSLAHTMVFCSHSVSLEKRKLLDAMPSVKTHAVANDEDGGLELIEVLDVLGKHGICSVLVEGGAKVHGCFLKKSLVDRVMLFMAPIIAGSEGNSLVDGFPVADFDSAPQLSHVRYIPCGGDLLIQGDLFR
jgi:diaminohydroxyphosphoribosylaminopyrimidine deaminase/5-amino-6-(5-phosphoribosylamino)uracil reductase